MGASKITFVDLESMAEEAEDVVETPEVTPVDPTVAE